MGVITDFLCSKCSKEALHQRYAQLLSPKGRTGSLSDSPTTTGQLPRWSKQAPCISIYVRIYWSAQQASVDRPVSLCWSSSGHCSLCWGKLYKRTYRVCDTYYLWFAKTTSSSYLTWTLGVVVFKRGSTPAICTAIPKRAYWQPFRFANYYGSASSVEQTGSLHIHICSNIWSAQQASAK